ncbi:MAG TPA: carbohydrate ABC transporter permease [Spirochaetia bacterium]|nr:carbohydrate ABC transporter permease [Spirochaetia bacterium]
MNRRGEPALTRWLIVVALSAGAVLMIAPFLWMISTSLKSNIGVFAYPPELVPKNPQWSSYPDVTRTLPFGRFFLNSVIVSISVTLLQLFVAAMAAYAFARLRFPGRGVLFFAYLSTLMIPPQVTLIPRFLLMRELGWINTYQGLIIPFVFSSFGIFLLRQYFLTIPRELEEAARIDGVGYFKAFWLVLLPLTRPGLAALAILTFIAQWNSFLWPLVVVSSQDMNTLTVGLNTLRGQYTTAWNLLMAGSVLATMPILIVFLIGNRYFISGITAGGFGGR